MYAHIFLFALELTSLRHVNFGIWTAQWIYNIQYTLVLSFNSLYFQCFIFFLHFIYMPAHRHTYGHLYIAHMYTDVMYIYIFQKHSLFLYCHNAPLAITKRRKLSYSGQQGKIELESISVQLRKEKNVFLQLHCSYRNPYYLPKGNEDELN